MSGRNIKISLKLSAGFLKKIDATAKLNYQTRSDFIRACIADRLNKLPADPAEDDPYGWDSFMASKNRVDRPKNPF